MKDSDSASGKDFDDSKIYCANCIHCKVIKTQTQNEGEYQLRGRISERFKEETAGQ